MLTLDQIETAIRQLPNSEIRELAARLQKYLDDLDHKWDQQLESDLSSGKLDSLMKRAEADIATNQVKELNEILYDRCDPWRI
ncbi:MAG: hypothetical protein F6K50_42300 [Moorea sp. SIO3I7]|uniref:hypothetical protein n=1 Tax=unclassified Moorena TaxID=2683338 RepID=UPI0013BE5F2E|nr:MULTISPECIES: hypothetical protein [unclassified Moorena]NEO01786.1 hypothetical protein [Moorena sp. SIO3I7]NEO65014.1 hypothetical protein [Moorena sp. SIO4G2]NEQ79800.1 hypothetical protein [Moorena sp. SIO2I5]NEO17284.1 hypothetical protein [Moorena sp. SIO3E8]NEO25200.1 hypothetical protein [Moorena sp. SIO4A5]